MCQSPFDQFNSSIQLNCVHIVHKNCMVQWMKLKDFVKDKIVKCPVCGDQTNLGELMEGINGDNDNGDNDNGDNQPIPTTILKSPIQSRIAGQLLVDDDDDDDE